MSRKNRGQDTETHVLRRYAATLLVDAERLMNARVSDQRDCPSCRAAVIFSVLSLEAFLNEIPDLFRGLDDRPALRLAAKWLDLAHEQRLTLIRKISIFWLALTGEDLNLGAKLWQDLTLLIDLRNAIVHSKPQVVEEREPLAPKGFLFKQLHFTEADLKLGKRLRDAVGPSLKGNADGAWRDNVSSPEAALWAMRTVNEILRAIVKAGASQALWQLMASEFAWDGDEQKSK